ncbi:MULTISPECIES: succinate dehydrogenase [Rhodobacterales]|uniref:Succinate dehydrogenase n=1 Tax=Halocynthiibacter styelae TaxID=2761955 RepID=A0A8J7J3S5_9RHOB|nr:MULTISPECIES: succinate dehydrogenase [Rhodobacterales]MBI1492735.1 succinate dehydrogenase [Paenihalocynthiibacter styelae]
MASYIALAAVAFAAAGCTLQEQVDNTTRAAALRTVVSVSEDKFPGVNVEPVAACIINQASSNEIFTLAGAAVTGINDSTVETVVNIAARPDAVKCIARESLSGIQL